MLTVNSLENLFLANSLCLANSQNPGKGPLFFFFGMMTLCFLVFKNVVLKIKEVFSRLGSKKPNKEIETQFSKIVIPAIAILTEKKEFE